MFFGLLWIFCCITSTCPPKHNKGPFSHHKSTTKHIPHMPIQTQATIVPANYMTSTISPILTARPLFGAAKPHHMYTTPKVQSLLKTKPHSNVKDTHKTRVPTKPKISINNQFADENNQEVSRYTTRYDYVDVEAFVQNERLVKVFFNCFIDKGPCTRESLELKSKCFTYKCLNLLLFQ